MGDTVPARVMSVDEIDGKYLLLVIVEKGGYFKTYSYMIKNPNTGYSFKMIAGVL